MNKVMTCLWYDGDAMAAAKLYTSIIANSSIEGAYGDNGHREPLLVDFIVSGMP
jgi:predicted 3-demethylubiquinone-9 3-methyltransferase (glyoxalase superfamily)